MQVLCGDWAGAPSSTGFTKSGAVGVCTTTAAIVLPLGLGTAPLAGGKAHLTRYFAGRGDRTRTCGGCCPKQPFTRDYARRLPSFGTSWGLSGAKESVGFLWSSAAGSWSWVRSAPTRNGRIVGIEQELIAGHGARHRVQHPILPKTTCWSVLCPSGAGQRMCLRLATRKAQDFGVVVSKRRVRR